VHELQSKSGNRLATESSERSAQAKQEGPHVPATSAERSTQAKQEGPHVPATPAERSTQAKQEGPHVPVTSAERSNQAQQAAQQVSVKPEQPRVMASVEQVRLGENLKDALTVHKGESYAHCAERLLSLAGNNDPTGGQIRRLARQLWIADHKREAYGLRVNQVLNLSDEIKKNKDLAKLFT
jgi:hypothetical protein